MSIATAVTRGYGTFGSIADVVTRGYEIATLTGAPEGTLTTRGYGDPTTIADIVLRNYTIGAVDDQPAGGGIWLGGRVRRPKLKYYDRWAEFEKKKRLEAGIDPDELKRLKARAQILQDDEEIAAFLSSFVTSEALQCYYPDENKKQIMDKILQEDEEISALIASILMSGRLE